MMLHPHPHPNILLSIMDSNLAQITRTWVAAILLTGKLILPPITTTVHSTQPERWTAPSNTYSLIQWTNKSKQHIMHTAPIPGLPSSNEQNNHKTSILSGEHVSLEIQQPKQASNLNLDSKPSSIISNSTHHTNLP
jgi:hypothetical protein